MAAPGFVVFGRAPQRISCHHVEVKTKPRVVLGLMGALALLLSAACEVGDGDCPDGGCPQTCAGNAACSFTCSGGGCEQVCPPGGDCAFDCGGGDCIQRCEVDAFCSTTCDGGRCDLICEAGATCQFECAGKDCE